MAYRVEVTVRAARDLGSIYDYIRAENSLAAARWFNGLEQAVYGLATMPLRCRFVARLLLRARKLSGLSDIFFTATSHIYTE
jgi:plasmid stabilization system protein ParE